VKALLNEYVDKGLRLVQLKKDQMKCYPELVRQLAAVPLKFIIFIDDLSFSGEEEDYKILEISSRGRN
jgi:predicted AAA+ superfamily ATPase